MPGFFGFYERCVGVGWRFSVHIVAMKVFRYFVSRGDGGVAGVVGLGFCRACVGWVAELRFRLCLICWQNFRFCGYGTWASQLIC